MPRRPKWVNHSCRGYPSQLAFGLLGTSICQLLVHWHHSCIRNFRDCYNDTDFSRDLRSSFLTLTISLKLLRSTANRIVSDGKYSLMSRYLWLIITALTIVLNLTAGGMFSTRLVDPIQVRNHVPLTFSDWYRKNFNFR